MKAKKGRMLLQKNKRIAACFIIMMGLFCTLPAVVFAEAESETTEVAGKEYVFGKDSHYEFHESDASRKTKSGKTYGTFCLGGEIISSGTRSGVPSYEVADGNLLLYYNYEDTLLHAEQDAWHLVEDKSREVDDLKLPSNIGKGAILLQTSTDRTNWVEVKTVCNAFSDVPIRTDPIYAATDVQLINGCYYRVIVVYESSIKTKERKFLFLNVDEYDYRKYAEIYEFYAYTNSGETEGTARNQTYNLGEKKKVKNSDGYYGEELIDKSDIHYGWELGNFFVSGYTDKVEDSNGNLVFLKNVGDKVTLWFKLNQDINHLNGKENLSITADTEGYDQYFETPKMNFGRGVLLIRYTDYNNIKGKPTIYTNYLEANTVTGADTKVQLFEEGDYEVALDYEVTSDGLFDKVGHYRIFFRFSVRNGNCMVYPFDVKTGSELTNSAMTENGFRLDLAKSRYLRINLKREILKDSADGLVEDTRFNGPAKDGAEYTDEGIYTITVGNEYTGQFTTKKIYVGTNHVLRAYLTTGLSIPEINDLLANGATISEDGTIQIAAMKPVEEPEEPAEESPTLPPVFDASVSGESVAEIEQEKAAEPEKEKADEPKEEKQKKNLLPIAAGILVAVCALIPAGILAGKKKRAAAEVDDCRETDGRCKTVEQCETEEPHEADDCRKVEERHNEEGGTEA